MPDEYVLWNGQAMHHQDSAIRSYLDGVRARRALIDANVDSMTFVIPRSAKAIFLNQDPRHGYPSQAETPLGTLPLHLERSSLWDSTELGLAHLHSRNENALRLFTAGSTRERGVLDRSPGNEELRDRMIERAAENVKAGPTDKLFATALPDGWMLLQHPDRDEYLDFTRAVDLLFDLTAGWERNRKGTELHRALDRGRVRIVSCSRSRLNPRYRGRVVIEYRRAVNFMMQAALCLAMSQPYEGVLSS